MATLAEIQTAAQAAVDAATNTIAATTKTQAVLEQQQYLVNSKISAHNADESAHPYIRQLIANIAAGGSTTTEIVDETGETTIDTSDVKITLNMVPEFELVNETERNMITLYITATDNEMHSVTRGIPIYMTPQLNLGAISFNCDNYFTQGSVNNFNITGVVSRIDETKSPYYDIICDNANVTISKLNAISQGENITIAVPETVALGTTLTFTVTLHDRADDLFQSTTTFTRKVTNPPSVTDVVCNFPANVVRGDTGSFTISGAVDPDGDTCTYALVNAHSSLTFSQTVGIADGASVTYTVGNTAPHGENISFTIRAYDPDGGCSDKVITAYVNDSIEQDELGVVFSFLPNTDNTISFVPTEDSDGQTVTYTVTTSTPGASVTDATGIAGGVDFTIHSPTEATIARGTTWPITVTVEDGVETYTYAVNVRQATVPTIVDSQVSSSIEGITMHGGAENAVATSIVGPTTDANGVGVTYNITNISSGLTFSKTTGIASGEAISVTASKVTQATTASFSVTVTNALGETSATSVTMSFTVDPIEVTAQPTFIYPTTGVEVEYYNGFTMTWSDIALGYDTGEGVYPSDGSET